MYVHKRTQNDKKNENKQNRIQEKINKLTHPVSLKKPHFGYLAKLQDAILENPKIKHLKDGKLISLEKYLV